MSGRTFFDSNLLVYAFGPFEANKSIIARRLIVDCADLQHGVISYQVVQEFLNIAFKKFQPRASSERASQYLEEVVGSFEILPWSMPLVTSALSIKHRYAFSWFDSLIVAAAIQSNCSILYTEDLQSGQVIEGLTVVNPFL
jgi:predicted nucleic acid-binding protein